MLGFGPGEIIITFFMLIMGVVYAYWIIHIHKTVKKMKKLHDRQISGIVNILNEVQARLNEIHLSLRNLSGTMADDIVSARNSFNSVEKEYPPSEPVSPESATATRPKTQKFLH
jgi:hypothetical protein